MASFLIDIYIIALRKALKFITDHLKLNTDKLNIPLTKQLNMHCILDLIGQSVFQLILMYIKTVRIPGRTM